MDRCHNSLIHNDFVMVHRLLRRPSVTRSHSWYVFILLFALSFVSLGAPNASAQPPVDPPATAAPPTAATSATQPAEDDDAAFRPLEPDFTLINLPTTLPLPLHKGNFRLTHRFNGDLRRGDFGDQASDLFGLD